MIEILPIKLLTDEDSQIFGSLNVALGKLARVGLSVSGGIVITAPQFKLKTILEHFDFGTKEMFEQSLSLVKKEINSIPIPEILQKETKKRQLFLNGQIIKSQKDLWQTLLSIWVEEIKIRLWQDGFYKGISDSLDPQVVIFIKKVEAFGGSFFDPMQDEVVVNIKRGKLHPNDLKKIDELVRVANIKLFIPHEYEWILDGGVRLTKVLPYTPLPVPQIQSTALDAHPSPQKAKTAVKVFLDLSTGLVVKSDVDGIYIASEKIFDLNKPRDSFEDLVFRLVESSMTFPNCPILFKLADMSEGMGQVRGTLRLLHNISLFQPMVDALDFTRHKKGLTNVHIVIPFVRGVNELIQIKRKLTVRKLARKNSFRQWLEVAVPENIINLADYLLVGLDGIVLNMDQLISHFSGFDLDHEELTFYKKESKGLIKFLEDALKLLHKVKVPFIAYGSLSLYSQVLEFLVEKGVYGVVVERYEAPSIHDLLHHAERRLILRRS